MLVLFQYMCLAGILIFVEALKRENDIILLGWNYPL